MAFRIMRFADSKLLFYIVTTGSVLQATLACTAASLGMVNPAVSNHVNVGFSLLFWVGIRLIPLPRTKIIPIADAWLGVAVVCDSTIT